jgi:hypothetical protein
VHIHPCKCDVQHGRTNQSRKKIKTSYCDECLARQKERVCRFLLPFPNRDGSQEREASSPRPKSSKRSRFTCEQSLPLPSTPGSLRLSNSSSAMSAEHQKCYTYRQAPCRREPEQNPNPKEGQTVERSQYFTRSPESESHKRTATTGSCS